MVVVATTRTTTKAAAGATMVVVAATITRVPQTAPTTRGAPPTTKIGGATSKAMMATRVNVKSAKKTNHIAKDCDWRYADDTSQKKKSLLQLIRHTVSIPTGIWIPVQQIISRVNWRS